MAPLSPAGPAVSALVQSAASPSVALDAVFRFASDARYAVRHLDFAARDIVLGEREVDPASDGSYAFPLSIRPLAPDGSTIEIGVLNLAATPRAVLARRLDAFLHEIRSALPRAPSGNGSGDPRPGQPS